VFVCLHFFFELLKENKVLILSEKFHFMPWFWDASAPKLETLQNKPGFFMHSVSIEMLFRRDLQKKIHQELM